MLLVQVIIEAGEGPVKADRTVKWALVEGQPGSTPGAPTNGTLADNWNAADFKSE